MPGLFTLGIALIFIVPLALLALQLGREAHGIIEWPRTAQKTGFPVPDAVAHLPVIGPDASTWWQNTLGDPGSAGA